MGFKQYLKEYGDGHVHKAGDGSVTGPPIISSDGTHFHRLQSTKETGPDQPLGDGFRHSHPTGNGGTTGPEITV